MVKTKTDTVATSEAEDNTEILARQECSRLARQLRLMENDKRAYLDESNAAINRQRKLIEMLEKENSQIQSKIDAAKEKHDKEKASGNMEKIIGLVNQWNQLEEEYTRESEIHQKVAKKISSAYSRVKQVKSKVDAKLIGKELPLPQLENKLFVLNKKLETVRSQFDAVVGENTTLRDMIDETLKLNTAIKSKCAGLEEEVDKGKDEIHGIVAAATAAYDQREETVAKINALTERTAKETKQYTLEMSELSRLVRHEEKLLEFMSTKNKERVFLETDDERISRLEEAKESVLVQAIESYRENFEKLLTSTSPTIECLTEEYKELHADNMRRFAYINELNSEVEKTQSDFFLLREEIKKCSRDTVERNRTKNLEIISKEAELVELKEEFQIVKSSLSAWQSGMAELVELVKILYRLTNFNDTDPVLALLGKSGNQEEITSQTAIMYMNIIQPRVAELINFKKEPGTTGSPLSAKPPSKAVSEVSLFAGSPRPRIIVSASARSDTLPNSDEDIDFSIVDQEQSPLGYGLMRHKVLDFVESRSGSSVSGDDFDASSY